MFKRIKFKREHPEINLDELNYQTLPPLKAEQLLKLLGQHNRIRSIQRIVSIDSQRFDELYLEPMKRFCESAQLAPASTDYHHTAPGGLIVHTFAMVEYSVHQRRKYSLPLRSDPEMQQREKHAWTYGVFVAALLHDIGKLVTLCRFRSGQILHSPYAIESLQHCDSYSIEFVKSPYKLHQYLSMSFFQIIPKLGQAFLSSHLNIMEELTAYFNDDAYAWGTIGEIVRYADSQSVAENLKLSNQKRFPNAPNSPLHERLITSLRQIIRSGFLGVNRPGAAIWTKGEYTYLMSKSGVDSIRDFLNENGATDIPRDNRIIFDTLQQFGLVHSTPDDKAIWKITVRMPDGFNQSFTVLKFDTKRIFHPSNIPPPLKGAIHEQEASSKDLEQSEKHDQSAQTEKANGLNTKLEQKGSTTEQSRPGAENHADENEPSGAVVHPSEEQTDKNSLPTATPSKALGEEFIQWLYDGVKSKDIRLNEDSYVHVVNYKDRNGETHKKAGVVTPTSFKDFANYKKIVAGSDTNDEPFIVVQKSVHKTKLAIKNGRFHIHQYRIKNATSAKAMLRFYLFDTELIVPEAIETSANDSLVFTK